MRMSDVPATSISGPREPSFVETTQISCEFLFQYATRFAVGREGRLELELRRLDERSGDASFR